MTYRDDDAARGALADALARRKLPMLDRLEVASPCDRAWDDMMRTADERVRACGGCNKHVYNVSGMTAEEVDRLMLETDATVCVRYFQRADGTILLADCTIGRRRRARVRYAAGLAAAVSAGIAGHALWPPPEMPAAPEELSVVMGEFSPDEPLPGPPAELLSSDEYGSDYSDLLHGTPSADAQWVTGGFAGAPAAEPSFDVPDRHVELDIDRNSAPPHRWATRRSRRR